MKKGFFAFFAFLIFLLMIKNVHAHCPLCTAGAAAAAVGATWLGVNKAVIGIFVGAFAVSIGWWMSKLIKRSYIPFQRPLLILLSFITTILPLLTVVSSKYPIYVSLTGEYGSVLNRTYIINLFLFGGLLGGLTVAITPWLSKKISDFRNGKIFPYQGTLLTMALLIILSAAIEIMV